MLQTLQSERLDPRVKRTRHLLLQAFLTLAREKGPNNLTVQEITERATINRATFYAHFNDLDDFLEFVVSETFQETLATYLPADARLSPANLTSLGLATHEFLARFNGQCSPEDVGRKPKIEAQVQRQVYRILVDWFSAAAATPNQRRVDPRLKAAALSWALYGIAMDKDRLVPEQTVESAMGQLLTMFVGI